jgi:alpha-tubulin suppressor-like RCC1 family protein
MDFLAPHRTRGSHRRGSALILAAIVAALAMAIAAPAQATPNVAQSWGQNGEGTLGDGFSGNEGNNATPVAVKNLSGVTEIASERGSTFYGQALALLESSNAVWGWGRNGEGQVGDGTTTNKDEPVAVCAVGEKAPCAKHLEGVKAIAAGATHSLAVLEGGTVAEWGESDDGSKGSVPAAKSGLSAVKAVAGGYEFSLALLEGGKVMAWGKNNEGDLGDGSTTATEECGELLKEKPCAKKPVEVSGLSGVKAISAADHHALALLENGTVVAWGSNGSGELGNGTTTSSDVPVVVCAVGATSPCSEESKQLKGVTAVAAGQVISVALLANGTVVDWGSGRQGGLGNGSETSSDVPVVVCAAGEKAPCASDLSGVTAIAAGGENGSAGYALLESGKVMDWGDGTWKELGNGSNESHDTPVTVCASGEVAPCARYLENVKGIAAGDEQGFAIGPFPTVTAISPKAGPAAGGNKVTITGTGFIGATEVRFGSTKATSFKVNSESSITAISPAGSGSVFVIVSTPVDNTGTSSADQFTYAPSTLPELGRCVEAKGLTGEYKNHFCVSPGEGHGRDNWLPGPGSKPKFSGTGEATTLETVGNKKIECKSSTFVGEYTGAKSETVTVDLTGCIEHVSKASCQSNPTKAGEIETTQPLEGVLGFITSGEKPVVGWDLKPKSPATTVATFECGKFPEATVHGTVEGSVIAPVKATNVDQMVPAFGLTYTVKAGKQVPERFQGGEPDTLTTTLISGTEKTVEQSGLKTKELSKSEEPLEIKAK